jgi:argininosuccinate synthase
MNNTIVLAFSGGLDTSFCIPYLKEKYGAEVHAVMVDCLGMTDTQIDVIREKAYSLGASNFEAIPAFDAMYRRIISYLIKGNVLRDRTYPLSVGAERFIQAEKVAEYALKIKSNRIAHGSTGAGNDQVRFDVALRTLLKDVDIITPIRDNHLSRKETTTFLRERGFDVSEKTTSYSINDGIWGTTIGGKETVGSDTPLPFDAFPFLKNPADFNHEPELISITFMGGLPVALNGKMLSPLNMLCHILDIGRKHGIGRGMHLGDTILGIKGRVGFEAPVATILYFAHKELEKLVLTKWQRHYKDMLADNYGMLLHEGQFYDPAMRDIEAYFDSSQNTVEGTVSLYIGNGILFSQGVTSPNSLMNAAVAKYGEESSGWTGDEARAFSKLTGLTSKLANFNKL